MTLRLSFRRALITGASSGLGAELARSLAHLGIPLYLTGRDPIKLKQLADSLQSFVPVDWISCDLSESTQTILDLLDQMSFDLVINNAGFTNYGPCLSDISSQKPIAAVNAMAPFEITLKAAHCMRINNLSGIILNVSSAAALLSFPQMATYAASKAFLSSFSQSFDAEMRPFDIRVLVCLPGQIATPFASRAARRKNLPIPYFSMPIEKAVRLILRQIERKKPYILFDWKTRWAIRISRCFPKSWIEAILNRSIAIRIE